MKLILFIFLINYAFCYRVSRIINGFNNKLSGFKTYHYHKNLQEFSNKLLKIVAEKNNYHVAVSPYAIWLSLSAIVEGASEDVQPGLLKALNLPRDVTEREKYYKIATELEDTSSDVTLSRKRLLILDVSLQANATWMRSVQELGLINPIIMPIFNLDPRNPISRILNMTPRVDNSSNSVLIDALDYKGLWTNGFSDKCVETRDFYDDEGNKLAEVEYMISSERAKFAIIPFMSAKMLELKVGNEGRYRMIFIMNTGKNSIKKTVKHFPPTYIIDIFRTLGESLIPIELAIPKFNMTSHLDLKESLVEAGLGAIFKNGTNSQLSTPPAVPFSQFQGVSINITTSGLNPPTSCSGASDLISSIASLAHKNFIVNRPFIYGLVDSETRTWLFSGVFSDPRLGKKHVEIY